MDSYKKHIKNRCDKIREAITGSLETERAKAINLQKDYIDSVSDFPKWLTIFSGVMSIFGIFDKTFLLLAFFCFLFSSLIILWIKYSLFKICSNYIKNIDLHSKLMSDFSHKATLYSRSEIQESEMKKLEIEFDGKYEDMWNTVKTEDVKYGNTLINFSFLLIVLGGIFLSLSISLSILLPYARTVL
ncbi:MAG: hypothetical protein KAQ87_02155 [Candidatus Pacebacteria bacterium]|nr:hypothetical protein [Candidatus Paceibacterota bacterium]